MLNFPRGLRTHQQLHALESIWEAELGSLAENRQRPRVQIHIRAPDVHNKISI